MRERRKTVMVHKKIQFIILAFITISMLVWPALLYYLIYYLMLRQMLVPEAIINILIPVFKKMTLILLFILPIVIVVISKISLAYSNKILGPLKRIEKELFEITKGDIENKIEIRKGDEVEVHGIINEINILLDQLQKVIFDKENKDKK